MDYSEIKLVLASASPRREALLRQIGFCPVICPSRVEEKAVSHEPSQVVMELSMQKAREVSDRLTHGKSSGTIILGSDTVVFAAGQILGKPGNIDEAYRMLSLLQGGCHQVFTGVTLIIGEREDCFYEKTDVYVYPMTREEILDYIAAGESMDKAGAYGIQGRFAAHIKKIEGSYTNVMGLPIGRVYQELKRLTEECG